MFSDLVLLVAPYQGRRYQYRCQKNISPFTRLSWFLKDILISTPYVICVPFPHYQRQTFNVCTPKWVFLGLSRIFPSLNCSWVPAKGDLVWNAARTDSNHCESWRFYALMEFGIRTCTTARVCAQAFESLHEKWKSTAGDCTLGYHGSMKWSNFQKRLINRKNVLQNVNLRLKIII